MECGHKIFGPSVSVWSKTTTLLINNFEIWVYRYLTGSVVFGAFQELRRPGKNAGPSFGDCLQFLQEVYSIFSENNLKEYNVRVSCICHCRLQRNALNAINLFALSQTATFSKKFSFRFNSTPTNF